MMTMYEFDFSQNLAESGWSFMAAATNEKGKAVYVESEGYCPDKGAGCCSPAIPVAENPWQFYRMAFKSKALRAGEWAAFFYDADGELIVSDIYASIYGSDEWVNNTVCFRGREGAETLKVAFRCLEEFRIKDLKIEAVTSADVADWSDGIYATLPPLDFTPLPDRWACIPHTMERLRQGGAMRWVMLGDSIINDTNNSCFDALLARLYPKADIRVNCSVRGATGCWHYREEEHFQAYVVEPNPDILIIGGISHREDSEAIRDVIRKTKERIGCEILLMSGPMAKDWRDWDEADPDDPLPIQIWPGDPYCAEMACIAEEEGVEYLDMKTIWQTYLVNTAMAHNWFHRDTVHADDRGKQILGRILERYFAPK
jgi:hypothetical protein